MAAPEIDLPSEKASPFGDSDDKIRYNGDSMANCISNSSHGIDLHRTSPITYHYLTFETPIPMPSIRKSSNPSARPAPAQPDLKEFTSPFEWSESRKSFTIWLSCVATLITAYTAGSYSPPSKQMSEEWHVSEVAVVVGITTFCAGFAMFVPQPYC